MNHDIQLIISVIRQKLQAIVLNKTCEEFQLKQLGHVLRMKEYKLPLVAMKIGTYQERSKDRSPMTFQKELIRIKGARELNWNETIVLVKNMAW